MKDRLDVLLVDWVRWKDSLEISKKREMELRKQICKILIPSECGTNEHGSFRAKQETIYKIDESALESIYSDLEPEDKECITWKPKVKFASLSEDSILWDIITSKPATPVLTRPQLKKEG